MILDLLAVASAGLSFIISLLLSLSYTLAYRLKNSFSIFSLVAYFWGSALIYFVLLSLVLQGVSGGTIPPFYEILIVVAGLVRAGTGFLFLLSTWKGCDTDAFLEK